MNEFDILEKISQVSGKNDKRSLLKDNKDNVRLGQLLDAGLNFFRKYYINKFDVLSFVDDSQEQDLHDEFMSLLSKLENREITGNDAKSQVESFFQKCTSRQVEWYSKVLRKDFKMGVSVDSAAEHFDIPTFDVMLATDGKKCKQLNKIISGGVFVSPKFDGYRCLAIIDNGDVKLYSRNGSEFTNFPTIQESLAKAFPNRSLVLDGEIMSDDFQAMQKSAFASKRGTTVGDVKYHVFDTIPMNEWKTGKFLTKKKDRYLLLGLLSESFDDNVKLVEQGFVTELEKVLELERLFLTNGYEGAMVVPDIPYYKGRSSNKLMKFKTMQSQDCTVEGMYEGEKGSRLDGVMGGLKLIQENGLKCECGTGFSDEDRKYMYANQSEFIGRIAEIKYQELSKDGVMRFPVFVRWRDNGPSMGKI